ncbi:SPOR domain-containing protein [Pollutimonas harenae]|uniref:SPOR domain-containing protein n=1 Tax=Pollutimonas harenae TaxID=657015 RepID=A0A853GUP6_9BURK|nr:SPOR domain-containing protein [Pollutimonas harenae]NYT84506.1 SPOR domain-containing protein [Pollutimonas harenae]TEA73100.1 SPOR domain-containing protein [Pollutimonas harenae]
MARTRRKSSNSKSGGSTLFGILIGLIFGLVAAVAVALFVTQVPMPFVDKASRDPAQILLPDVRNAPDPNLGLYGKDSAAGSPLSGPTITGVTPLPGLASGSTGTPPAAKDNLGDLIASLSNIEKPAAAPQTPSAVAVPGTEAPAATAPKPAASANTQTTYYLQAGAFRSEQDAESVKARILLLGLPATVQAGQSNGSTIHRVRVGPFKGIDEMNRSRARLGEEKIVSTVVRP